MLGNESLTDGVFVAVDIETTGCIPGRNGVMEIGAVRIEKGRITARFERLLDPGEPVPYAIESLTGITDEMVQGLPALSDALPAFREFVEGAVLIAHNHRFDLGFLDYASELQCGRPFVRPVLDTLVISRRLDPELVHHNLAALSARYRTTARPTHRALADAGATAEVFLGLVPRLAEKGMATVRDVAVFCGMEAQSVLSQKLPLTTELPDTPGVYLFRDASDEVIYVGIANNLRSRVRNYFYAWGTSRKPRIAAQARSIEYVECSSALEAMLLENSLVAEHRPRHNGRVATFGRVALQIDSASEFPSLKVTARPARSKTVIGPFTNRVALERLVTVLKETFDLKRCTRDLGGKADRCPLREVEGACPHPCLGEADAQDYATRVVQALAVFDGDYGEFRSMLVDRVESARREADAVSLVERRDALRALERSVTTLNLLRQEGSVPGRILVECTADFCAVHLIRHGRRFRTLHLEAQGNVPRRDRVARALQDAYGAPEGDTDLLKLPPDALREMLTINTFRHREGHTEIEVGDDLDEVLERVLKALGRVSDRGCG